MVAHTQRGRQSLRPALGQAQGQNELYIKTLSQIKGQCYNSVAAGLPSMNMALSPTPET